MQSGMPLCGVLVGWLINGSRSRLCENTAAVQFQGHRAPPAMLMVDPGLISRSFLYVRACQSSFIQPRSNADSQELPFLTGGFWLNGGWATARR